MNKVEYILNRCEGKRVLDLGCVQNTSKVDSPEWLHRKLLDVSDFLIGVDITNVTLPEKYIFMPYDIEIIDESPVVKYNFDVVVLADVIEHLFNPGLTLDAIKNLRFKELVIVTPNAKSPSYWSLTKDKCEDDHTCWYSENTLTQLLQMKGYEIKDISFSFDQKLNGIRPLLRFIVYKIFPKTGSRLLITASKKT